MFFVICAPRFVEMTSSYSHENSDMDQFFLSLVYGDNSADLTPDMFLTIKLILQ